MNSQSIKLETPEGIVWDVDVDFEVNLDQSDCGYKGGAEVLTVHIPDEVTDVESLKYLVSQEAITDAEVEIDRGWM